MILSLYFVCVIDVLGLTLAVVLCVKTGCDLKTPALYVLCGVEPTVAGVADRTKPVPSSKHRLCLCSQ